MLSFINRHLDHLINTVTDCVLVVVVVGDVSQNGSCTSSDLSLLNSQ